MEEKILEVVPVNWKKGFFKQEPWALVITDQRMLFAKWTQELFKKEFEKRKKEVKKAGGGKLKQFFAQIGTGFTYHKKYYEMTPDEIISEHNENFSLTPSDVLRIDVKMGRLDMDEDGHENPNELIITSKNKKMVFTFNYNYKKVRSALSQVFNV